MLMRSATDGLSSMASATALWTLVVAYYDSCEMFDISDRVRRSLIIIKARHVT